MRKLKEMGANVAEMVGSRGESRKRRRRCEIQHGALF